VSILTRVIADAAAEGLIQRHTARGGADSAPAAETEPLAEWERELLAGAEPAIVEAVPVVEPVVAATETESVDAPGCRAGCC